jgi:hypothetical protein
VEVQHRILEYSGSPLIGTLKAELDKMGVPYQVTVHGSIGGVELSSIEFTVGESDPLYPHFAELIKKFGFYVQSGVRFSEQEIDEAEWLAVRVGGFQYPQPEDTYMEATYDISSYCPHCGMGAVQNNPFRLKSDFRQNAARFLGLHWVFDEVFVRPEVKSMLEQSAIAGIGFLPPVHHRTGQPIETVYQMIVRTIAEPGLVTDGLQPVTCRDNNEEGFSQRTSGSAHGMSRRLEDYAFCGRVKYHYPTTTMLAFTRSSLEGLPDVAKSYEFIGSGAGAHRLILVTRRFVDLVKRCGVRGMQLTPIRVL